MPHLAATWLNASDEGIFALSNSAGQITIVKLSNLKGMVTVNQLKMGSYLGRMWGMLASSSSGEGSEAAMSLEIHSFQNDIFVLGLCKDHKLRMWSASKIFKFKRKAL